MSPDRKSLAVTAAQVRLFEIGGFESSDDDFSDAV